MSHVTHEMRDEMCVKSCGVLLYGKLVAGWDAAPCYYPFEQRPSVLASDPQRPA